MTDKLISSKETLLEVNNLKTYFFTREGVVKAIDGVDFQCQGRRDFWIGGRIRLREKRHLTFHPAPGRSTR